MRKILFSILPNSYAYRWHRSAWLRARGTVLFDNNDIIILVSVHQYYRFNSILMSHSLAIFARPHGKVSVAFNECLVSRQWSSNRCATNWFVYGTIIVDLLSRYSIAWCDLESSYCVHNNACLSVGFIWIPTLRYDNFLSWKAFANRTIVDLCLSCPFIRHISYAF